MEIIDISLSDGEQSQYKCDLCDLVSTSKMYVKNHKRFKHTNEGEVHRCDQCLQIFTYQSNLKEHMKRIHDNNGKQFYQCRFCDQVLSNPYYRKLHEKRHSLNEYKKCRLGVRFGPDIRQNIVY